jgi:hypothetical protein
VFQAELAAASAFLLRPVAGRRKVHVYRMLLREGALRLKDIYFAQGMIWVGWRCV